MSVEVIHNPSELTQRWVAARGVVIPLVKGSKGIPTKVLKNVLLPALHHGCMPVLLTDFNDITALTSWISRIRLNGRVDVLPYTDAYAQLGAETIARHSAGPAWKKNLFVEGENELNNEEKILLRRSFGDANTVSLTRLPGGHSAKVYCAYASIPASRVGSRPLPFFVKFDRFSKIRREFNNYHECAVNYVPFNLRPNVEQERLALGSTRGILVGNFVEHSESLWEVVCRGAGQTAINSLFENTLRGWRLQAYQPDTEIVDRPLAVSMGGAIQPNIGRRWKAALLRRASLAAEHYGAKFGNYEELARLLDGLPRFRHRVSFTHGDLHGENVRVRGTDAILIDLASVAPGPLASDPAALDVWLGFANTDLSYDEWMKLVDKLYSFENLTTLPPPQSEPTSGHEVWNTIRQIRRVASIDRSNETEYATAIAIALLRRACYDDTGDGERRRIYGYFIADGIARRISDMAGKT